MESLQDKPDGIEISTMDETNNEDNFNEQFHTDPKTGFDYIPNEATRLFKEATEVADKLYQYKRDFLNTDHKLNVCGRDKLYLEKINETLNQIDNLVNETNSVDYIKANAEYMLIVARCYNITDEFYFSKAEPLLAKACKLQPNNAMAWNLYGEHLWKLEKFGMAINCFKKSEKLDPNNTKNLCDLSMTIRKVALDSPNRVVLNEEAYTIGKKAVSLDVNNGRCWQNMGNAYMSEFFCLGNSPMIVTKAINSYQFAMKCEDQKLNPDVYYNAGLSCHFNDLYDKSFDYYSKAISLNPTWDLPNTNRSMMVDYLNKVNSEKVVYKGNIKKKADKELCDLKYPENMLSQFTKVNLSDLATGKNNGKFVVGRIMYPWTREDSVSYHLMLADTTQRVCVNVYNFESEMFLKCGDTMCILEPITFNIKVTSLKEPIDFVLIRVSSPFSLIVNGSRVTPQNFGVVTKLQSQMITRNPSLNYDPLEPTSRQLDPRDCDPRSVNAAHLSGRDYEYRYNGFQVPEEPKRKDLKPCQRNACQNRLNCDRRYVSSRSKWYDNKTQDIKCEVS